MGFARLVLPEDITGRLWPGGPAMSRRTSAISDPIIEDEVHVLRSCPRYNTIREKLTEKTAELLDRDIASMFTAKHAKETGTYIKRLNEERFGTREKST